MFLLLFSSGSYAELLPVKTYTVADGLLQDRVSKIKTDSRGFLWFCTAAGISRFDGYGFTNFTSADGLPDGQVNDFLETAGGTIYLATDRGLARLNPAGLAGSDDDPLFTVFVPPNPSAEKILTLYQDAGAQVWVGTNDGLYKLTETGGVAFEPVPLGKPLQTGYAETGPNTLRVNAILRDRHGTFWVGTYGSGLFRLSTDGSVRRFNAATDGFGDNKITDLIEGRDGRIWMSLRSDESGGVCQLDADAGENPVKKCYSTKNGLGSNWVRDLLETSDGQLWLATLPGLCQWQGDDGPSVCKTYTPRNDLCDDVLALAEDKDGNLWTGSQCGAKKIVRYGFTTYNSADGLDSKQVNSVFENSAGALFATTFPTTAIIISRFDGAKFSGFKLNLPDSVDYLGYSWQQTIRQDSTGIWWIPTGQGLFRSPPNTSVDDLKGAPLEKMEFGAKGLEVFRLFEDSRGDIWVLTTGEAHELFRWERAKKAWHDYTAQAGLSGYRLGSALIEDGDGNIWIGTTSDHRDSALIRYRGGEFRVLTQAEGAPMGGIQDLFVDSHDRLWVASRSEGLWRLDRPNGDKFEFIKYSSAGGLTNDISTVTEDEFGRIYAGSRLGIYRLDPETGQIESFTTADGLPTSFVEVSYRDRNNYLWFGTHEGLARFVPEPPRTRQPPTVLITGLRVEGEPRNVSVLGDTVLPPLQLNSDQKQVSVDFVGLGASLGEKLKYEYRLGGSDWTRTAERTVNFANLNSGDYRFEVRASTADRVYSQGATFAFSVAAPFWKQWWFIASALALVSFAVYLFYKNRLSRLLEMERMRTRIAADLHDDIGANLTRISLLSEMAKQKSSNGNDSLLGSIANIARESVASMNDIVWAIGLDHDRLLDLTIRMRQHAEEIFQMRDIELDFKAPTDDTGLKLSIGVRRDVLLIFKEAVNNAARHSGCSKVEIDFGYEDSKVILKIKDNGKGFDAESSDSDGQGLRSMTRRSKALGGSLTISSKAENGTVVKFDLGLAKDNRV